MTGIVDDSAPDLKIDSAWSLPPVVKDDDNDLLNGTARGLWSGSVGTINFIDGSGATRTGFPVFPGANMIAVRRVLTGGTAADLWAIY